MNDAGSNSSVSANRSRQPSVEGRPQAARRLHPGPPVEGVRVRGDAATQATAVTRPDRRRAAGKGVGTASRVAGRREVLDPERIQHGRGLGGDRGDVPPGPPGGSAVAGPGERNQADAAVPRGIEQRLQQAPGLGRAVMPHHDGRRRVAGAAVMGAERAAVGEADIEQVGHGLSMPCLRPRHERADVRNAFGSWRPRTDSGGADAKCSTRSPGTRWRSRCEVHAKRPVVVVDYPPPRRVR